MEDLILKIIDIEDRAQEVIKDAKQANKTLDQDIDDETRKLHRTIQNKAIDKSESLKETELKEADEKCESIRAESKKQIAALEKKYSENKDVWINKIVENIIGS